MNDPFISVTCARLPLRWLLPLLLALPILGQTPAADPPCTVAFADFGRALLEQLGETEAPPFADLLERHYGRLQLRGFDLRYPKTMLAKGENLTRLIAIAGLLLDLQDRTSEWTTADAAALKTERAGLQQLKKQVAGFHNKPNAAEPPVVPLLDKPCLLVLCPDRRNFVGVVGVLGLWKGFYRQTWWFDATAQFSDLRLQDEGDAQLIALEYAAPDQHGDVTLGYDMNTREKTGMLQEVAQRAAMSWCWRWLGDGVDISVQLGLATALVIDVLGVDNARSGGSGKGNSTEGEGGFIPGAPGQGGLMATPNADSAWRLTLGKDYFARVLRQAEAAGRRDAKDAKDKYGHFQLDDQKKQQHCVVTAPFLGRAAVGREVVAAVFVDDYLEFHRAYRAAFVHWLQSNGARTKPQSAELFARLMRRMFEQQQGVGFEALCQEVYGVPLSSPDAAVDSLERRFLVWIADGSR